MPCSNFSCRGSVRVLLFCFILAVAFPAISKSENLPNIEDIPMEDIFATESGSFNWFEKRFGLTWDQLEGTYPEEDVDAFLGRWRTRFPDDPEAWISSFNWNWRKSQVPIMFQADPQPGFFITEEIMGEGTMGMRRIDGQRGPQSGFVTQSLSTDENRYSQAVALYTNGLHRFPYRVDLQESVAEFHLYFGNYDELTKHLSEFPAKLRASSDPLETTNYAPVPDEKDEVIAGIFHRSIMKLADRQEAQSREALVKTALLMTKAVPANPIAWSNLGSAYYNTSNKEGAYSAYKRAYTLAPDDEIIVLNMAIVSLDMGFREEAIELNNWLIDNAQDPSIAQRAYSELDLLGEDPN